MTPAELYADVRQRITALVRDLPEDRQRIPVPGCPGWTVRDVVAHSAGTVTDAVSGNLAGAGGDEWTARQVAEREGVPMADLLAEWEKNAAVLEATLNDLPKAISRTVLVDLVTHEHDLRGALGEPGARDTEAYAIGLKAYHVGLAKKIEEVGLPGLHLAAPGWDFDAGPEPATKVTAPDSFELFRALSGRRGKQQVLAYDWSGDPAPYLAIFNRFGDLPEDDVVEAT